MTCLRLSSLHLDANPTIALPPAVDEPFDVGSTDDSLARILQHFRELGDTYRVYAPGRRRDTWIISNADDVKRVLVTNHRNYTKGVGIDRVKILLGNGIMVSEGDFWRRQRRMIQPAFHRRVIEQFVTVIASANRAHLERWQIKAARNERVNITTEMSELTLEIVLRAIFGTDLERITDAAGDNPFSLITREPARDLRFAYRFRQLAGLVRDTVRRRAAEPEAEHFDFIGMLMAARSPESHEPMSEKELIDEILTLIVAGHETTASALNWTWYLLACHPQAEAKLHAELAAREGEDLGLKTLESFSYTQQVIYEALRLYPPGWLITRRSIEPDVLGGFTLPAGTDVFLSPYVIHRHPAYWQEPERFWPERFTPEAEAQRPRYTYIPFVAGPRHCVGETFALYEMAMHLVLTARQFRLRLTPEQRDTPVELEAQINLRPRHDIYMTLERRDSGSFM